MTNVTGLLIPPELTRLFNEVFRVNDARRFGSVSKRGHLLSRAQSLKVSSRSLLPQVSALWGALTPAERLAWKTAGVQSSVGGWNLFVQDTCYRLKHSIPGIATPNIVQQYKVGRVEINSPASAAQLVQYHPVEYFRLRKVRGSKALFVDEKIIELLVLPLSIGISYRSNLIVPSGTGNVEFYAEVESSYQGRTIKTNLGITLPLSTSWTRYTATLPSVLGVARSYNLFINAVNVRGYIEFDNIRAFHTSNNYARDFRCNDVNNTLTRSNYQIEKSWEELILPAGSAYDSVYPDP